MTPKSLLRLPEATSSVDDLVSRRFQEVLDDPVFEQGDRERRKVRRIILCSGKVYYDLVRQRDSAGAPGEDVAIVRVEQLYPFHAEMLRTIVAKYPEAAEKVWVQEEPRNMGAYWHIVARTSEQLGWAALPYIGRTASATPATGSKEQHDEEQQRLLDAAIPRAAKPVPAAAR
jgi:2-oxoglutarate dehydrogenase E1 component